MFRKAPGLNTTDGWDEVLRRVGSMSPVTAEDLPRGRSARRHQLRQQRLRLDGSLASHPLLRATAALAIFSTAATTALPIVRTIVRADRLQNGYYASPDEGWSVRWANLSPDRPLVLQAVGDSTIAGTGVGKDYEPGSVEEAFGAGCFRSLKAWTRQVAEEIGAEYRNLACSGKTARYVIDVEVPMIKPNADIVFFSALGNNDDEDKSLLSLFSASMKPSLESARSRFSGIVPELLDSNVASQIAVHNAIRKRAPNAVIVALPPPNSLPLQSSITSLCAPMRNSDLAFLQSTYDQLMERTRDALTARGAVWLDLNLAFTADQRACQENSAFQDLTLEKAITHGFRTWSPGHPNEHGENSMARFVLAELRALGILPPPSTTNPGTDSRASVHPENTRDIDPNKRDSSVLADGPNRLDTTSQSNTATSTTSAAMTPEDELGSGAHEAAGAERLPRTSAPSTSHPASPELGLTTPGLGLVPPTRN